MENDFSVEQLKQGARNALNAGDQAAAKRLIEAARAKEAQTQTVAPVAPAMTPVTQPTTEQPTTNIPPIDKPVIASDEGERNLVNRSLRRAGQDILASPGVVALPRLAIAGAQYGLGYNETFAEGLLDDDGELRPVVKFAADLYDWAGGFVDAQDNEDGSIPLDEEIGGVAIGSLATLPILPARLAGLGANAASKAGKAATVALKAAELVTPVTLVQRGATRGQIAANVAANMAIGTAITEVGRGLVDEVTLTETVLGLDEDNEYGEGKTELGLDDAAAFGAGAAAVSLALGRGNTRVRDVLRKAQGGPADRTTELGELPTDTARDAARLAESRLADEQQTMVEAVRATRGDKAAEEADDLIKSYTGDTIDNQIERMMTLGVLSRDGSVRFHKPVQMVMQEINTMDKTKRTALNQTAAALNELSNRRRKLLPSNNQTTSQLQQIANLHLNDPQIRRIIDDVTKMMNTASTFRRDMGMITEAQRRTEVSRGFYMPQIYKQVDPEASPIDKATQFTRSLFTNQRTADERFQLAINARERQRGGGMMPMKNFDEAFIEYMGNLVQAANDNHVRREVLKLVADQRVMRKGRNRTLVRKVTEIEQTPKQAAKADARYKKQMDEYNSQLQKYEEDMKRYTILRTNWLHNKELNDNLDNVAKAFGRARNDNLRKIKRPKQPVRPKAPVKPKPPKRVEKGDAGSAGRVTVRENGEDVTYLVGDRRLLHALQMHPRMSIPIANTMRKFYQQFTTGYLNPTFAPMTAVYDMTMAGLGIHARKSVSGPIDAALKRQGVPDNIREALAGIVRTADLPITYMDGVFKNIKGKQLQIRAQQLMETAARTGHPVDQQKALDAANVFMNSLYGTMHRYGRAGGMFSEELDDLARAQNVLQIFDPSNLRFTAYGRFLDSVRDGMSMGLFARNYAEESIAQSLRLNRPIGPLPEKDIARIARNTRAALADPTRQPANQALNATLSTIPYGNVVVQSLSHLAYHMMTNRAAWSVGATIIGARLVFTGMMNDEQRSVYEREMPEWERIMYMPIPIGDGANDFIKVPLGHELGTLSAIGAEVMQGMIDADNDLRVISTPRRATNALLDLLGFAQPTIAGVGYAAVTGQQFNPRRMARSGLVPEENDLYGVTQQRGIGADDGFVGDRMAAIVHHAMGTTGKFLLNTLEAITDHPAGAFSSEAMDQALGVATYEIGRQPVVRTTAMLFNKEVTKPGARVSPLSDKAYRVDKALRHAAEFVVALNPDTSSTLDADIESNPFQMLPQHIKDQDLIQQAQLVNDYFSAVEHRLVLEEISNIHQSYKRTVNNPKIPPGTLNTTLRELNDRLAERYTELLSNYGEFETYMRDVTNNDQWTVDKFIDEAIADARKPAD